MASADRCADCGDPQCPWYLAALEERATKAARLRRNREQHRRVLAEQLGPDPVAAAFRHAREHGARDEQKRRRRQP